MKKASPQPYAYLESPKMACLDQMMGLPTSFLKLDEPVFKVRNLEFSLGTKNKFPCREKIVDLDEFENEIPGGFEEVQSFDQCSTRDDTDRYVECPKFDLYIREDWSDIEVSSDIDENRAFQKKGFKNCLKKCQQCGSQFLNQIDLNAHELTHHNEVLFECHYKHC